MSKDFLRKLGLRGLSIGDSVYYIPPSSRYAVKRSRIADIKMSKLGGIPYFIEIADKVVMANGDIVDDDIVFLSKVEAINYLTKDVVSSINYEKIALANCQHRIRMLERRLKVLQKRLYDD